MIDVVRRDGVDQLRAYFDPVAYTGQWFETFAGGGDRTETRDLITLGDLYAVQALSVQVPFAVGRELLEGQLGQDMNAHLREIPTDVELGSNGAGELVAKDQHADRAWWLLNNRNEKKREDRHRMGRTPGSGRWFRGAVPSGKYSTRAADTGAQPHGPWSYLAGPSALIEPSGACPPHGQLRQHHTPAMGRSLRRWTVLAIGRATRGGPGARTREASSGAGRSPSWSCRPRCWR